MVESWFIRGAIGGVLIGVSASLMLVLNGRVTGISGIVNALMRKPERGEHGVRVFFIAGLLLGGAAASAWFGHDAVPPSIATALVAGALVGVGTRLGNGCTSGHGVCGISRLSARSFVATLTFISTGALAVLAARGFSAGGTP